MDWHETEQYLRDTPDHVAAARVGWVGGWGWASAPGMVGI